VHSRPTSCNCMWLMVCGSIINCTAVYRVFIRSSKRPACILNAFAGSLLDRVNTALVCTLRGANQHAGTETPAKGSH